MEEVQESKDLFDDNGRMEKETHDCGGYRSLSIPEEPRRTTTGNGSGKQAGICTGCGRSKPLVRLGEAGWDGDAPAASNAYNALVFKTLEN